MGKINYMIEQAFYTQAKTQNAVGYQFVSKSENIKKVEFDILRKNAVPGGVIPSDFKFESILKFFKIYNKFGTSFITLAPTDNIGRPNRYKTHFLLLDNKTLELINFNPFRLFPWFLEDEPKKEVLEPIYLDNTFETLIRMEFQDPKKQILKLLKRIIKIKQFNQGFSLKDLLNLCLMSVLKNKKTYILYDEQKIGHKGFINTLFELLILLLPQNSQKNFTFTTLAFDLFNETDYLIYGVPLRFSYQLFGKEDKRFKKVGIINCEKNESKNIKLNKSLIKKIDSYFKEIS